MTNKFREKFFFSILTSIATMLVIFLLPLVFGDSHISNWYFEKVSSVLITYKIELLYLQLSILTGLCIYVYRKRKVKGLLSEQPSHHTLNYQRVLIYINGLKFVLKIDIPISMATSIPNAGI